MCGTGTDSMAGKLLFAYPAIDRMPAMLIATRPTDLRRPEQEVEGATAQIASAAETSWAADASEAPECEIRPDSIT